MSVATFPSRSSTIAAELLDAIRALRAKRGVVHCEIAFQVPVFAVYGKCPVCGMEVKVRSFSGEPELEDVFDAVLEWMTLAEAKRVADIRLTEIESNLHE